MTEQARQSCPAKQMSPLTLAFLGDALYELLVREHIVKQGSMPPNRLHRLTVAFVKASFQAQVYDLLEPQLQQDEGDMLRRGRNTSSVRPPKNADMAEYRKATGVETLFGYLHLCHQEERARELFAQIVALAENGAKG